MRVEIGDTIKATQDIGYFMGQAPEDKIEEGEVVTVEKIRQARPPWMDDMVYVREHADRYGPFPLESFIRVGPAMCPLCGSTELEELGRGDDFEGFGCLTCKKSMLLQPYDPEM